MNKEEVKNALEYCINDDSCWECPFVRFNACQGELIKSAIQCISEQEEEIKTLQEKLVGVLVCVKDTNGEINIEKLQKQAVKKFAVKLQQKYGQSCSEYYPELITLTSEQLDELVEECN